MSTRQIGTRHEDAWRIPKDDGTDYGVLVRCGPKEHPYWWLLCPATSTLYIRPPFDLTGCSDGYDGCDHVDVHQAADALRRQIDGEA